MAARDSRQAIKEAEAEGSISKITVDEETQKKLISESKKSSIKMFIASIIILAVAVAVVYFLATYVHIAIVGLKMIILYLFILIFPFVSLYSIFTTFSAAKKGDYEFYAGQIIKKDEKGYMIRGLEDQNLNFTLAFKPSEIPANGSDVKIFRIRGELSLFR